MAADSAIGGVLEKNGDHLPDHTIEKLKEVLEKFQSKPGAEHAGKGGNGDNGVGNGGTPGNDTLSGGHDSLVGGHDSLVGGHDSLVGGSNADYGHDLGGMKIPDLSGVSAVGGVAPVDLSSIPSAASHADAVIAKAVPAAQVDLTLIGQSVDVLTKKLGKLTGGH